MENYTLNRFYHEAKAMIEKYELQGKPEYRFNVEFKIEECQNKTPGLHCIISYCPIKYDSREPAYYGFGCTPYICLNEFEETLKKATGKPLIENVCIELSGINQ